MIVRRLLYFLLASVIILLDQTTKILAVKALGDGKIIRPFDNDFIWLILVYNSGSAFGMKLLPSIVLAVIAFIAAVGLGYYLWRKTDIPLLYGFPLALIMGGAIGNLIDRVRIGEVIDYFSVDMPNFIMNRFPVFNIADSAVSVGITIIMLLSLFRPMPKSVKEQASLTNTNASPELIASEITNATELSLNSESSQDVEIDSSNSADCGVNHRLRAE
ncbi:MAG: signal peptidase II [Calditrichaeota bacterium]|nr:signal peptidase II [Calditrichota bacterium]